MQRFGSTNNVLLHKEPNDHVNRTLEPLFTAESKEVDDSLAASGSSAQPVLLSPDRQTEPDVIEGYEEYNGHSHHRALGSSAEHNGPRAYESGSIYNDSEVQYHLRCDEMTWENHCNMWMSAADAHIQMCTANLETGAKCGKEELEQNTVDIRQRRFWKTMEEFVVTSVDSERCEAFETLSIRRALHHRLTQSSIRYCISTFQDNAHLDWQKWDVIDSALGEEIEIHPCHFLSWKLLYPKCPWPYLFPRKH